MREALSLTQATEGTLYLLKRGALVSVYSSVNAKNRVIPRLDGYTYECLRTGKMRVVDTKMLKVTQPKVLESGMKSVVMIPLSHHKKNIGVLTLRSKKVRHFTLGRLDALKVFSSVISLAIQKNLLNTETMDALKTRDLFISMAAHELRTPTTTIKGYTEMMQRRILKKEPIPDKWVEILAAETLRLNNLLMELLQINQIKTGQFKYEMKNNSLRGVINRVIASIKMTHPDRKIVFDDQLEKHNDMLYSDFDKIMQSIINLVNNSIKFSPKTSTITIMLRHLEGHFKIAVKDEGKGIEKKDIPHIFEGFYKGQNNANGGMGLGLFLTEIFIQRHNGFISLKTKLGKGTIMEINLPSKKL